ncbi:MAG: succinate dehydrogenase, hydrophobic membrane anchor protein [Alphaproteobacteria bacterium]
MSGTRSTLGRVRHLGSAKDGTAHWWAQRLTAVALVPLALWFAGSVVSLAGADHGEFTQWLGRPVNALLMIGFLVATFHHAQLGLQVVIEDYVHGEGWRTAAVMLVKFAAFALGLASVFAVLKVALGG